METLRLNGFTPDDDGVKTAARILREGGIVAIPTETVYGLAANAYDADAIVKVFEAKGRPQDNPLIVHISEFDQLYPLVTEVPETAKKLAEAFWPGPLTMVLPKSDLLPDCVSAGLETVAIRMPSDQVARAVIDESGCPLAAPSANLSGRPSPTTAAHVVNDLDGRVDGILMSGDCEVGVESTVILLANGKRRLLRPGGVTLEMLEAVIGPVELDRAVLSEEITENVSSPGMKYKHYSPDAKITLVKGDYNSFCEYVNSEATDGVYAMIFNDDDAVKLRVPYITYGSEDYKMLSHALFDSLRILDKKGAKQCFVRYPDDENDDNLAVLNRLLRAAGFNVVSV